MLVLPTDHQQIARLFDFLLQGEQLAFECASRQVQLFDDRASQNFLRNQVRQEKFHHSVFKAGVGILAPRGVTGTPGSGEMRAYRALLQDAWRRGDQAESLLAMQVLLEGLGDVTLKHIGAGFKPRKLDFLCRRVRHLILGQEDAHHSFGLMRLQKCIENGTSTKPLLCRSQDYLGLLDRLLQSAADLFEHFDEDPQLYLDEFHLGLPAWLRVPAS